MSNQPQLPTPALVVGTVAHARLRPLRHAFSHRTHQWLVDLGAMPRVPWWLRAVAGFRASDHLTGTAERSSRDPGAVGRQLRAELEHLLGTHGESLGPDDRVLMLCHARVLGHVFDPLTVFWVLRPDASVRLAVLEVHNTYGERHGYVVHPDAAGLGEVDKAFYVSPFNDVSGRYRIRLRLAPDRVRVSITLDRRGTDVFTASFGGRVVPFTPKELLRVTVAQGALPYRVSALIRFHGLRLWARRLPVQSRPPHPQFTLSTDHPVVAESP